jgi:hypothetical protein
VRKISEKEIFILRKRKFLWKFMEIPKESFLEV